MTDNRWRIDPGQSAEFTGFFVGDPRAPRLIGDGTFPWTPERHAVLAESRQVGDMVLLRYALSERCVTRS